MLQHGGFFSDATTWRIFQYHDQSEREGERERERGEGGREGGTETDKQKDRQTVLSISAMAASSFVIFLDECITHGRVPPIFPRLKALRREHLSIPPYKRANKYRQGKPGRLHKTYLISTRGKGPLITVTICSSVVFLLPSETINLMT